MPATYEPIATTTLSSAAASITFSSIPGTYTDLRVVCVVVMPSTSAQFNITFNSDTNQNYSFTTMTGNGTAASSTRGTNQNYYSIDGNGGIGNGTAQLAMGTMDIFNYANTNINKTVLGTSSNDMNGSGTVRVNAGLWRSTNAITTIKIDFGGINQGVGTTATIYGIKAA